MIGTTAQAQAYGASKSFNGFSVFLSSLTEPVSEVHSCTKSSSTVCLLEPSESSNSRHNKQKAQREHSCVLKARLQIRLPSPRGKHTTVSQPQRSSRLAFLSHFPSLVWVWKCTELGGRVPLIHVVYINAIHDVYPNSAGSGSPYGIHVCALLKYIQNPHLKENSSAAT